MLASKKGRVILFVVVLVLIAIFMYFMNTGSVTRLGGSSTGASKKFEKAKVVRVINQDLEINPDRGNLYNGSQELELKILTGEHKGEIHTITNNVSIYLNVVAKKGQTIIVNIDSADPQNYLINVYSYYRAPVTFAIILLFFAVLWWIGGKKGLTSILGIIFTFACIVFLFIPMIYNGYSPIWVAVLVAVLTTFVTLILLNGWSSKSISAIFGTMLGVGLAAIIASVVGSLAHISGYNVNEVDPLIVIADQNGMQLKDMLFAGIILSSLGAIMDVGISIAASIHEVYLTNPKLTKKELFSSGINVGRDMMGPMANTLILAFTGTTLTQLMLLYSVESSFTQLTNMNMVTIEIIQGVIGCLGVVLTVPMVAFIASRIIPNFDKKPVTVTTKKALKK